MQLHQHRPAGLGESGIGDSGVNNGAPLAHHHRHPHPQRAAGKQFVFSHGSFLSLLRRK
jgi:hypothetical protein